jgi:hypothetical protein
LTSPALKATEAGKAAVFLSTSYLLFKAPFIVINGGAGNGNMIIVFL